MSIMFADLVGSTAMSLELDPEDMRDLIQGYQNSCTAVIERYGGFVARYMGDGIMCYFGYPHAHEDDAERAIRAALEITQAVRDLNADETVADKGVELAVRVGIASGLVVIGNLIGKGASEERPAVGETPNLAARMQTLADPNCVVIDPGAYRLAGDVFKTQSLGPRAVKGSPEPIEVWQVLEPRDTQSRFDMEWRAQPTPLVGRDDELNQLRACWELACSGKGQVLLLSGESGIGKSRLARTAYTQIAAASVARARYQCRQLYADSAFYPFIEQLEQAATIDRAESQDAKFAKLRSFLRRLGQDTEELRALMARLLSIDAKGRYRELNLSPRQLKQRTIEAFCEQIVALAKDANMLVLFEDLHWADPSSLELLDSIVSRVRGAPLLLICTYRPDHVSTWHQHPHVSHIALKRLEPKDGELMIEQLFEGVTIPASLKREILDKTDGVPLFVEELIRALRNADTTSKTDGKLGFDAIIPDTLQSSLMARLDQLASAKGVAQTGAAIGREFHYRLLARVASVIPEELDSALFSLVGEGLVNRQGLPPESRYAFQHTLLRDAAYQSLLRRKRRDIHGRIARALEQEFASYWESNPEILAHHLTEANDVAKAIDYWEAAARKAIESFANIEAERHFRRAVDLVSALPSSSERAERELRLLTAMGAVLINNHGPGSAAVSATYERCRELCEEIGGSASLADSSQHFATLWGLWRTCESLNVAMDLVDQMRALGENERRPDLIMQAHHSGWATLFNLGELKPCIDSIEVGESLYDREAHRDHADTYGGHDPQVCAHGIGAVALVLSGYPDQGAARINKALALAEELQHPGSLAHALDFATTFHRICDEPTATLESANAFLSCGSEHEFADYEARGKAFRGWAMARLGSEDEGLSELRASILAQRETGTSEDFPLFLEMLAEVCALVGQPDEGLVAIEEAWHDALRNEAAFWSPAIKRRQAALIVQLDSSRLADAVGCLEQALAMAQQQRAQLHELNVALDLARLWRRTGKENEAVGLLRSVQAKFEEGFDLKAMIAADDFLHGCVASG